MHCVLCALDTTEKEKSWRRGRGVGGRVIGSVWGLSYLKEIMPKTLVRLHYPSSAPGADR